MPFIHTGGMTTDLNSLITPSSPLRLVSANGINDSGQIVGDAIYPDGSIRAYLLTPIVPEPASLTAVVFGVALLRRRRRSI
jgi:hypothetical protein